MTWYVDKERNIDLEHEEITIDLLDEERNVDLGHEEITARKERNVDIVNIKVSTWIKYFSHNM